MERINVRTEDEILEAITIIIKERGRGSITGAVGTSFTWLLDPKTLEERGASFSTHYLSPKIRERILNGESVVDIANEIRESKKAPNNLEKTFEPKQEVPGVSVSSRSEEKVSGEPKDKNPKKKYKDYGNSSYAEMKKDFFGS